jgi:signal transduction histidine kinase
MDLRMNNGYYTSSAYLIPFQVDFFSRPVLLSLGTTAIGRDDSNTIQIEDDSVSYHHADIEFMETGYVLKDLGSQNGSFVNGKRIERRFLNHHDKVGIGSCTFLFLLGSNVSSATPIEPIIYENKTIAISDEDVDPSDMLAQTAPGAVRQLYHKPLAVSQFDIERASDAYERLSLLYQLSEQLRGVKDSMEIIDRGLELIFRAIPNAERSMVLLREEDKHPLEVKAIKHRKDLGQESAIPISRTVLNWVLGERMVLVSRDVTEDQRFEDSDSIRVRSPNSIVCVPFLRDETVLGVLYIETSNILDPMTQEDAAFAAAVANELALNLDNIRLQHQALQNARMAAIGLTITNLAHNIKNLIMINQNAMKLMDMHLARFNDPKIDINWECVQRCYARINLLSSDMLEYAKESKTRKALVDINRLIVSGCDIFKHQYPELRFDLSPENPVWMMDEGKLQRALMNLVVNALEATRQQKNSFITIKTTINDGRGLTINVTDNGEGIPPDKLPKICDLFFTTKGTNGNGLGLPMVQKFVERMGGKLLVKSKPGIGSSFSMVFPK